MLEEHIHNHHSTGSNRSLLIAIGINLLLTFAQVVGGIISGSLSLVADALHNLSDATSLSIALLARKISTKPADEIKTFGYQRAEVIAALINLTLLITISLYLIYEAIGRIIEPQVITGWIIIIVAGIALIVDMVTAFITYRMSKNSINMKAAFLHNLSDALASVGVLLAGTLIIFYDLYWMDTLVTFLIAGFILWHGFKLMPKAIHLLMEGTPEDLSLNDIKFSVERIEGVENIHHIHIWHLDEHRIALEAHVVVTVIEFNQVEIIKVKLKELLKEKFDISHSTLEFEFSMDSSCKESM